MIEMVKAASTDQTSHGVTTGYPGRQHLIGGILPRAVMTSARYEPGRAGELGGWAAPGGVPPTVECGREGERVGGDDKRRISLYE